MPASYRKIRQACFLRPAFGIGGVILGGGTVTQEWAIRETGELLGEKIAEALTFYSRLRGLMLTASLPEGSGLHIRPCRSVHSFFMKYPIDVLHLSQSGEVVGLEHRLQPGKVGKRFQGTFSVVELPEGTLERVGATVGQTVFFPNQTKPNQTKPI